MPYIKQEDRAFLDDAIAAVVNRWRADNYSPGELNYIITCLILAFWEDKKSYKTGNEIVGVLECVKQEFYRRHLAPYEDLKIKENGDVIV